MEWGKTRSKSRLGDVYENAWTFHFADGEDSLAVPGRVEIYSGGGSSGWREDVSPTEAFARALAGKLGWSRSVPPSDSRS